MKNKEYLQASNSLTRALEDKKSLTDVSQAVLTDLSSSTLPMSVKRYAYNLNKKIEEGTGILNGSAPSVVKEELEIELAAGINDILHSFFDLEFSWVNKKLRILFGLCDSTEETLNLTEEYEKVQNALKNNKYIKTRTIFDPSFEKLRDGLLDFKPHHVHLSGHGDSTGFFISEFKKYYKKLDNEVIKELFDIFNESINFIFLNYCRSYKLAEYINEDQSQAYIVGMKDDIKNQHAIDYSINFYKAISAGEGIEFAHNFAKLGLKTIEHNESEIPPYKIPTLYKPN